MHDQYRDTKMQVSRSLGHWCEASARLHKLDELASQASWDGLEAYLNVTLKSSLQKSLFNLQQKALILQGQLYSAKTVDQLINLQVQVDRFKDRYLRTETLLDFYADAINTRTNNDMAALMRACDRIASGSMKLILEPLGKKVPPVLTYIDKGLGASILKAGLRLWDGETASTVAAIKVVRHNLYRPTALIHEAGHQVAHILNWNDELAEALDNELKSTSKELGELWSGWASEIAADTFAFVHTGYASIAGLHDVVSGESKFVFRHQPMDAHPISYLRVLLGIAMCKVSYGEGPWDQMERVWKKKYSVSHADREIQNLIKQSEPEMERIARCCLHSTMKSLGEKSISYWIKPNNVAPNILYELATKAGSSLYTSNHWISNEAIRLLALGGYQIAAYPDQVQQLLQQQRQWMLRLGGGLQAA